MNSSRRWLVIFAIVISILVIGTVSMVLLTKGNEVALLQGDTPQGIVQRYLVAIQEKDYQKAYTYLHIELSGKIFTYSDWLNSVPIYQTSQTAWKATLGKTTQYGDNATVEVNVDTFRSGGPFANAQGSQQITFQLSKIDGNWFITSPTYIFWIY
jgi:hypothetical protein